MAWQDDVNATWRNVGRKVGADFQFNKRNGVPSILNKGKIADGYEGKLVRRSEEWTVTLEYIAEHTPEYDELGKFYTTTTMKARPNKKKAKEWEIFREVSKDKAPRGLLDTSLHTLLVDPNDNWRLPIKDYATLVTLFSSRRIDVPKLWAVKQQEWGLQKEKRKLPRKERDRTERESGLE